MQLDQESLRRKNEELVHAFRAMLGQVQDAASDAVDHTIQAASVDANRFADSVANQIQQPQPQIFPDMQIPGMQQAAFVPGGTMQLGGHMTRPSNGGGMWAEFRGQEVASRECQCLCSQSL